MTAASKSSHFWTDAMESDGFVMFCGRFNEREGFIIISKDPARFTGLRKIPDSMMRAPFRGPLVETAAWISGGLNETEVRSKLAEAGLSTSDIDAKLEWARQWATTITVPPGSEPVHWWPDLSDWKNSQS